MPLYLWMTVTYAGNKHSLSGGTDQIRHHLGSGVVPAEDFRPEISLYLDLPSQFWLIGQLAAMGFAAPGIIWAETGTVNEKVRTKPAATTGLANHRCTYRRPRTSGCTSTGDEHHWRRLALNERALRPYQSITPESVSSSTSDLPAPQSCMAIIAMTGWDSSFTPPRASACPAAVGASMNGIRPRRRSGRRGLRWSGLGVRRSPEPVVPAKHQERGDVLE